MWRVEVVGGVEVHVHPLDDLKAHVLTSECWCQPRYAEGVEIHNSLDQREKFERGERKAS